MKHLFGSIVVLALCSALNAQNPAGVIVDDKFANGNSQLQDLPNNSLFVFNGRTNNNRSDQAGSLTLDMTPAGTSSEAIWAFFTDSGKPLHLGIGDRLTVSVTFSTTGLKNNGQDVRFGVLDSQGTRNTTNLTGGMNDGTFLGDTGYGLDYFASGTGSPFVIGRRTVLTNANVFNNFGDFATIAGTGASDRQPIVDGIPYTLLYTIQRTSATNTTISASLTGGSISGLTYSAVENSPTPATTFDYFAFRVGGTNFSNALTFYELAVAYVPSAPVITSQPQPTKLVVQVGSPVTMTVGAAGNALSYQWLKDGAPVVGNATAQTAVFQINAAQLTDAGSYTASISNAGGAVTSNPVVLGVSTSPVPPPPSISRQPANTTIPVGASGQISVAATGNGLFYQWFKNGVLLPNQTNAALVFSNASVSDAGNYYVVVSNSSGSVTSQQASLLVVSTMSVLSFAPYNGQDRVCTDTSLTLTLDQAPQVGKSGKIQIYNSAFRVVDTIDMASSPQTRNVGGSFYSYYPVMVHGNVATIYPRQPLPYNDAYFITMEPGVLLDSNGAPFAGFNDADLWSFFSRIAAPPPSSTNLTVSADGNAHFCTVQAALDFVSANNTVPVTITVQPGTYNEMLYVPSNKPFITLRGVDRDRSVIQYPDNNNFNNGFQRAMVGVDAADFTLENITLKNTTPHGGSQAEAFRGNNSRILLNRVNLYSFQDTLWLQGLGFVTNSYIEGDVDFMWGNGSVYFQNNELKGVTSGGYYTQIRNVQNQPGNVYVENWLTSPDGVTGMYLARIDPTQGQFPYSQVVYINNAMGPHIAPVGWLLNNATTAPNVSFWEYKSVDLGGKPLDVSQRAPFSRQITDAEAVQWSDPGFVLGGWVPYTVNAVQIGAIVQADWSASPKHDPNDMIGLYAEGTANNAAQLIQKVGTANRGHIKFATAGLKAGRYELRYLTASGQTSLAVSNLVTIP